MEENGLAKVKRIKGISSGQSRVRVIKARAVKGRGGNLTQAFVLMTI